MNHKEFLWWLFRVLVVYSILITLLNLLGGCAPPEARTVHWDYIGKTPPDEHGVVCYARWFDQSLNCVQVQDRREELERDLQEAMRQLEELTKPKLGGTQ